MTAVLRRRLALVAIATLAPLGVAACGGEDESGDGARSPDGKAIALEATEFAFDPDDVTVAPGEHQFEIVNRGEIEHALEVDTPGGEVETDRVAPGESATVTAALSEPGTYELYCPVGNHRELGMTGTVKVQEGAGGDSGPADGGGAGGGGY